MKKVSIIIPVFNKAKYVSEAIESALNQTYQNIEIICYNDGSNDNSAEIIEEFALKYKNILYFDSNENKGVVYARNTSIDASRGDYIFPLDADDTIEKSYIEKAVKILNKNPSIGIVYSKVRLFGEKNEYWNLGDFKEDDFLFSNNIFCSALFRKEDFIKAGKYKENINHGSEDWDLWLSFIEMGLKPYRIDEILFNYRQVKEKTLTDDNIKNIDKMKSEIIKNHINLFLNNHNFKQLFLNPFDFIKKRKSYDKYKRLFNIFLFISLIELLIISVLIFTNLNNRF